MTEKKNIYMGVVLHPQPACGESHIQHNGNCEIATFAKWFGLDLLKKPRLKETTKMQTEKS